jgi:hypothetical protein
MRRDVFCLIGVSCFYYHDHMTALALTDFTIMKVAGQDKKKSIWAGGICLLLTPVVFILTGLSVSPFDPSGFGTGMVMMIYGTFFTLCHRNHCGWIVL